MHDMVTVAQNSIQEKDRHNVLNSLHVYNENKLEVKFTDIDP